MRCINPVRLYKNLSPLEYPDGLVVPCGKCIHCKIQRRKEWSLRMYHENQYWENAMFLTLTYEDKLYEKQFNEPVYSLKKEHLQNFYKRLRKRIKPKKIKHFSVGEYGGLRSRPHYHSILFGLGLDDIEDIISCWKLCDWKHPDILNDSFGQVVPETIEYVAKYVDKIQSEKKTDELYSQHGLEPPFRLISKGIGCQYVFDNADQLQDLYLTHEGIRRSIPRYYLNKLGIKPEFENFTECDLVESFTGLHTPIDAFYNTQLPEEVKRLYGNLEKNKKAYERRLEAGINLHTRDKVK